MHSPGRLADRAAGLRRPSAGSRAVSCQAAFPTPGGAGRPTGPVNRGPCDAALKASFGSDGQPGSYTDIDHCDALALFGHNVAETQAVLWMRMLDRRSGPDPPRLLAVDPRDTPVAREADVHLAPRCGTNQALMNGLLREVLVRGWIDERFIREHTLGLEELESTVEPYTPSASPRSATSHPIDSRRPPSWWARVSGSCPRCSRASISRTRRRRRPAR
jgi:anaerobic selenocysteine-containing dehydrogenase